MIGIVYIRNNIFLLILVIGVGISLSFLSYHYSGVTANQISSVASTDIKSNAIIETDGLSRTIIGAQLTLFQQILKFYPM